MRKMKKILSILLVLVMVTSIFAGLDIYFGKDAQAANAGTVNKTYYVLEIVPNESMAQFGYLVGNGQEPINMASAWASYESVLNRYGKMNAGVYVSDELFKNNYLAAVDDAGNSIIWDIRVITRTPKTLTQSDLNIANLVVLSQTADSDLPKENTWFSFRNATLFPNDSYNYSVKDFMDNSNFSWDTAMMIFKRIAGAAGDKNTAPAFFVDYTMYSKASKENVNYGVEYAVTRIAGTKSKISASGSKQNAFKLYLMLTSMNPTDFYSLYFNPESDTHGLDERGYLKGYKTQEIDGNWNDVAGSYEAWGEQMLAPSFLNGKLSGNIYYNPDANASVADIGWSPVNSLSKGSATRKGRGIVYYASDNRSVSSDFSKVINSAAGALDVYSNIYSGGFRLLVVDPNGKFKANGNIAAYFIENFGKNNGVLGGIKVDNMSITQFAGTNKDLLDDYDAIYFSGTLDPDGAKVVDTYGNGKAFYVKGKSRTSAYSNNGGWGTNAITYYAGRDITAALLTKLNDFVTKKPVIVDTKLKNAVKNNSGIQKFDSDYNLSGSYKVDTDTNIYSFINGLNFSSDYVLEDTNSDGTGINYTKLITALKKYNVELVLESQPATYYDYSNFNFRGQNESNDYLYTNSSSSVTGDRYINTAANGYSRNLNFSFRIDDTENYDDYTVNLYLDMNGDGRFSESDGKFIMQDGTEEDPIYYFNNKGERFFHKSGYTANNGTVQTISFGMVDKAGTNAVLPSTYVGQVTWKFEIVGKNGKSSSVVGYSACKADNETKRARVNVLQIVSVDILNKWGNCEDDPLSLIDSTLFLPTKAEIAAATNNGAKDITSIYNSSKNSASDYTNLKKFFSGKIKTQTKNTKGAATQSYTLNWSGNDDNAGRFNNANLANAAIYYYMLCQQKDYDVNVKRVTTEELEQEISNGKIAIDSTTGRIRYADPDPDTAYNGKLINCDLLVLGFGNYSGDLGTNSLAMVKTYFEKGNAAFIGNGAVWSNSTSHKLTQMITQFTGMKKTDGKVQYTYNGDVYNRGNNGVAEATMTNYGPMSRYPLAIPSVIKSTAARESAYALDLSQDDITVYLSIYNANNGSVTDYIAKDDAIDNYLIFKKKNITFCSIGFNEGNLSGQKSFVLKLPEAGMIVNAITGAHPGTPDPVPVENAKFVVVGNEVDKTTKKINVTNGGASEEVPMNVYTSYTYFDANTPIKSDSTPLGAGAGGDIENHSDGGSKYYLCKPIQFKIDYNGSEKVNVKIRTNEQNESSEKDVPLKIFDEAGTNPVDVNNLQANKTYTIYVPIDCEYYSTNCSRTDYALINSTDAIMNNIFGLRIFTYTGDPDVSGKYPADKTERTEIQVGCRGIFRID